MWVPILDQNRDNVIPILHEIETRISAMREALIQRDLVKVKELIIDGQKAREKWEEKHPDKTPSNQN